MVSPLLFFELKKSVATQFDHYLMRDIYEKSVESSVTQALPRVCEMLCVVCSPNKYHPLEKQPLVVSLYRESRIYLDST